MTVGGVLQQALGLYQRFFWRFAAITAIVMVVLDLLSAVGETSDSTGAEVLWALVALVLGLIGTFLVQGALTLAVDDVRDGRADTSIGELFARTRPHLVALIFSGLLAGIGIGIGLLLLIAPGLYLLARWAVIIPTIMIEDCGVEQSLGRSSELTKGHRWAVLGVVVSTLIASIVISAIVVAIFSAILPEFFGIWLGNAVAHVVTVPFLALAWTVMYFDLRRAAEPPAEIEPSAPLV